MLFVVDRLRWRAVVRLSALLLTLSAIAVSCGSSSHVAFDSKKWKESGVARYRMVDDLTRLHLYPGAPQHPLFQLLGWPEINSGTDYTYSRWWGYCIRYRESDCSEQLFIHFRPPTYQRVDHVSTELQ